MLRHNTPKKATAFADEDELEGGDVTTTGTPETDHSKKQKSGKTVGTFLKTLISFSPLIMAAVYYGSTRAPLVPPPVPHKQQEQPQQGQRQLLPSSTREWKRTKFTLSSFEVAGVNLAEYGVNLPEYYFEYGQTQGVRGAREGDTATAPFELFDDFNIAPLLSGDQGWEELRETRMGLRRPSLSFYDDKIAMKRWMPSVGERGTKAFLMKYALELTDSGNINDESHEILNSLPQGKDYAAKPNHLSCSDGVWLTKTVGQGNNTKTLIGHGNKRMKKKDKELKIEHMADDLAEMLHKKASFDPKTPEESWILKNVAPGVLVEELFTAHADHQENGGALEFKVFTIWGRVWLGYWRPGVVKPSALLHRNGTALDWAGESHPLPGWLDWQRVVDIAEHLSAGKDMFRVDIFVGIPSGSPALRKGATKKEKLAAVEYVVNECEMHPTTSLLQNTKEIFDEGARLWVAGYMIGNYKPVANTEIPPEFIKTGMLSGKFEG